MDNFKALVEDRVGQAKVLAQLAGVLRTHALAHSDQELVAEGPEAYQVLAAKTSKGVIAVGFFGPKVF